MPATSELRCRRQTPNFAAASRPVAAIQPPPPPRRSEYIANVNGGDRAIASRMTKAASVNGGGRAVASRYVFFPSVLLGCHHDQLVRVILPSAS
jgi:hypothetical protein